MSIYKNFIDAKLIALLKRGDKHAFAEIYDRYAIIIYHKVNQMLRDEEASKDIIQDLFTTLWEKPESLQEDSNLAGYLYIASRNRVFKLIQKGKTKNDYLRELGKFKTEVSYEMLQKLDEQEMVLLIIQEIAKLSPRMRQVFELSRIENLSHKQIAIKLSITEATVRKQVQYALRILKERLDKVGNFGILYLLLYCRF